MLILIPALPFTGGFVSDSCATAGTADATSNAQALEHELASVLVSCLNLEMQPESIDPDAALFGEGLGLDSIDILELALEVSQRYGFQLRSDDENNQQIFQSLRSLAAHVARHRSL